jgi:hypothetical protein
VVESQRALIVFGPFTAASMLESFAFWKLQSEEDIRIISKG